MTVLITHDPKDTVFSAFGSTMDEAYANALSLEQELSANGHHTRIEPSGHILRPGSYGWNVFAKKIQYS